MFYKEIAFQETAIGGIPKDWEIVKIGEAISLEYGKGLPASSREQGTYPIAGSHGVIGHTKGPLVKGPGIVVGRKGTIGAVSWIETDFWPIDTTYYVKTKKESILLKWLFYELKHVNLAKLSLSDVVPGLKRDLAYSMKMPLPSFEEQKQIVEVLSCVDLAIKNTDEVIVKTEHLKKGLMQKLLTEGIGHKEFKDTKIGKTPLEWNVRELGDVAIEVYRYPTYYNIHYFDAGVPEVRGELIKEKGELEEDLSLYRFISEETSQRFQRTILKEGDFVLSVRGTMGKVAVVPERLKGANITANLIRISLDSSKCFPSFFKQFFLSDRFQKTLNNLSSQTTIKTIQAPKLKSIKVAIPPIIEQQQIAEILSTVDSKLRCEKKGLENLVRIKQSLMDLLLTGKVRVKVD